MAPSGGPSGSQPGQRHGQTAHIRSRARTPRVVRGARPRSSTSASDTTPRGTSTAAFFPDSSNTHIRGGEFRIDQGPQTNVTITVNQGTEHETDACAHNSIQGVPISIETPIQISRSFNVSRRESWSSSNRPLRSCEIYYKQLLVKNRGSPLWVPAPNTNLPLSYQRQGIQIGDVGIITEYGGFDFLFNIFLPSGHPNNADDLPEDFAPLDPLKPSDVRAYSDFRPNSYLASSSVTKSRRSDSDPSGLTFESSDEEAGAILTMPNGSNSEDLGNRMRIRRYTAVNAERWYRYAHDVRGREAYNGDLRVVIGWDQSSSWGMAVFAKTTSQNGFRLKFKPNRGRGPDVGQLYDWECESGVFEGRTGPHASELTALRAEDPEEADSIYENQCLFVRTLNVKLDKDVWEKLISETDMGFVLNDLTNMNPSPSLTTPSSPASSFTHESAQSPGVLDNQPSFTRRVTTAASGSPQISRPPSALAIHPLNYIHDKLLLNYPNGKMVIIEDDVWMSVLEQNEAVMPGGEELYQRIMVAHNVVEEDGFIFLDSKGLKEDPSWAANEDSIIQEERIGAGPLYEIFRGTFAGRAVAIKKLVVEPFKSTFHRAMDLWTDLGHPNVLPTYAGTTKCPFLYITPYMEGGTLVQFLKQLVSSKALPSPTMQLGLPQPTQGTSDDEEILQDRRLLTMMYEIANGMGYLHSQGILHGALKAANILLDDNSLCVISDFGQTTIRKECGEDIGGVVGSPSGYTDGYVRWSSPELLRDGTPTEKADVWAFSITCVEILTMGQLPWPLFDNDTVRHFILSQDSRPTIPLKTQAKFPTLQEVIFACWRTSARERPSFMKVVSDLQQLRLGSPTRTRSTRSSLITHSSLSSRAIALDIPLPLQGVSQDAIELSPARSITSVAIYDHDTGPPVDELAEDKLNTNEAELDDSSEDEMDIVDIRLSRIERRYRHLLTHRYHPSLTLPLWTPSMVGIGAVGYLQRSTGSFVTLFNAFSPRTVKNPAIQILPSLNTYGEAKVKLTKPDKKSLSRQLLRTIPGASTFGTVSRFSFQLNQGATASYLYAEDTEYRYMDSLDGAKQWLQDHNLKIFNAYQSDHKISPGDIRLVTGTLQTSHYALLVNHHPCPHNAEVTFKASRSPKKREPWGTFSFDDSLAPGLETNVSMHDGPSKTILIARLRIRSDSTVATAR